MGAPYSLPFQRQGVEQTSHRRSGDVGDLEDRGSPGDGVHEMFRGNQVGQQGRTCRAAEGASGTDQEQHSEDRPHSMQPRKAKINSVRVHRICST